MGLFFSFFSAPVGWPGTSRRARGPSGGSGCRTFSGLIRACPATNARPLLVGYISRLQPVTARLRLFNMAALALEMRVSDPVP